MSEGAPSPQINLSKIPGGGGIAGALFALGTMAIFLVAIPRIRFFFVAAIVAGAAIALALRRIERETPGKPWILPDRDAPGALSRERTERTPPNRPKGHRRNLLALPAPPA